MKKLNHLLLLFILVLLCPLGSVIAQNSVQGKVTSEDEGMPLIGVTVLVKGTSTGTVTDLDGKYSIPVPDENTTLVFSYTGYTPQEIMVGAQSTIDVILGLDIAQLNEVVVVGYGAQKKATSRVPWLRFPKPGWNRYRMSTLHRLCREPCPG